MANALTLAGPVAPVAKYEGSTIILPQRDTDNVTDVLANGLYTGGFTPSGIKWSWKGSSPVAASSVVIGAGAWSCVVPNLAGDEGTLSFEATNDASATVSTYLALGDNFYDFGDSIGVGAHINSLTGSATPKHNRWWNSGGGQWVEWDSTSGGPDTGCWPYVNNEITAHQSVPVAGLNVSVSGSEAANWAHGQADFDGAVTRAGTAGAAKFRAARGHLLANNARGASGNTAAAILAKIKTTCDDLNLYIPGGPVPIFWAPIGPIDSNIAGGTLRDEMDAVRQGWLLAVAAGYIYPGPYTHDLTFSGDGLHPENNDAADLAGRWWLAMSDVLYGTSNGAGPRISSITYNAAKTSFSCYITKAMENSPASSTIGFRVKNGDASFATVTAMTISTTNKLTLTVSPAATGTPTVTFGSGNDAVGASAPKGVVETLPSGATVQRPLEFFYDQATTLETTSAFSNVFASLARC